MASSKAIKIVTPIVVAVTVLAAVLIASREPEKPVSEPRIYLKEGAIIIEKTGTRLADIAQAINDPAIFSYDASARRAQSTAHLFIAGEGRLVIGSNEQGELLEFNTNVCGDASIRIEPKAVFEVTNSEIATVHRTISAGICTRGYTMFCDGTIRARNSKFLYISGNRSEFFRENASGDLENVVVALSDGASLRMANVDGSRLRIRNCRFETAGKFGVYLLGNTKHPVRIESCSLIGAAADVFMSMGRADLVLVDCTFGQDRVRFENARGSVRVVWRAHVRVEKAGKPVGGAMVLAECEGEKVTGSTDAGGLAVLEVTERMITADGSRLFTPHRFEVLGGTKVGQQTVSVAVNGSSQVIGEIRLGD